MEASGRSYLRILKICKEIKARAVLCEGSPFFSCDRSLDLAPVGVAVTRATGASRRGVRVFAAMTFLAGGVGASVIVAGICC